MSTESRLQRWFAALLPRRGWIFALALIWGMAGVFSFARLKRDLFPDLGLPILSVLVQGPGLAPPDLERSVAQPVEQALGGMPGVKRVTTLVLPELVQVVVALEEGTDLWQARQGVSERLSALGGSFPSSVRPPLVSSASGRLHEVMEIVLEGPGTDPLRLRDHAEQVLVPRLQAVPGVARVELLGGQERALEVALVPERAQQLGVALEAVVTALEGSHQDASVGVLEVQDKAWFVTAGTLAASPEAVRRLPVPAARGTVALGEVAEVREAPAFRRGLARNNGREVVSLRIVKQPSAPTLAVAEAARRALAEVRKGLPQGMSLDLLYDQGGLVRHALNGVSLALLLGGVLVAGILVALLGRFRAALPVLAVLPLATFGAALPLHAAGLGLNAMTLGGLAIAVGLLVDAAVIMVENLAHRFSQHPESPRSTVLASAASEVAMPILTAVLVILAVFIPLLSMGGLAGRLYAPLALAVASAMTLSLLMAFTLVPVLTERLLPPSERLEEPALVRAVKRLYRPALDWALGHGLQVRLLALGLTIPCLWMAFHLGSNFLPTLDERAFMLLSKVPSESSLEAVDRANLLLDRRLMAIPGVASVYRRSGRADVTEDPCPMTDSEVMVILAPKADARTVERAVAEAAEAMPFPVDVNTPMQERIAEGIGGTPADIQVKLHHRDLEALRAALPELLERLAHVEGVRSASPDTPEPLVGCRAVIDEEALRRLAVPRSAVAATLQAALQGVALEPRFEGPQAIPRLVRFQGSGTPSPMQLGGTPLVLEGGRVLSLGQVVRFEEVSSPALVRREGGERRLGINVRTTGDLGGTARRIEAALEGVPLPPGTLLRLGGKIEEARDTQRRLMLAVGLSLALVAGLLYLALRRWREVLVVVATLPDAFAGALFALWLAGETWNISSLVGMIGLLGVAVQNSLVLITQAKGLMAQGTPFEEALREASLGRVRPKLMTAGASILGLLPMLLGFGGSELERPLAIAMVGGLVTSTLFTLLALPSFYAWIGKPEN